jgi:hypothetical protein
MPFNQPDLMQLQWAHEHSQADNLKKAGSGGFSGGKALDFERLSHGFLSFEGLADPYPAEAYRVESDVPSGLIPEVALAQVKKFALGIELLLVVSEPS